MRVKTSMVRSAGGVVFWDGEEGLHVLLIATHGNKRWSLPKGRLEPGEDARSAALREVMEETGITARVLAPLETVEYWFYTTRHHRFHKFVEYFLMAYEAGTPMPQLAEVDAARWWLLPEAGTHLSYPNDQRLLRLAVAQWQGGK